MPPKSRLILALAVALFTLGFGIFFVMAPRQAKIAEAPATAGQVQVPAAPLVTPAPVRETETGPVEIEGDKPPLLLILAMLVTIATLAQVVRLFFREKSSKQSEGEIISELQNLAYQINSWTLDDDRKVLDQLNRDAKRIGAELYRRGGKGLMLKVHRQAGSQRVIESAWDGIGPWRG